MLLQPLSQLFSLRAGQFPAQPVQLTQHPYTLADPTIRFHLLELFFQGGKGEQLQVVFQGQSGLSLPLVSQGADS